MLLVEALIIVATTVVIAKAIVVARRAGKRGPPKFEGVENRQIPLASQLSLFVRICRRLDNFVGVFLISCPISKP